MQNDQEVKPNPMDAVSQGAKPIRHWLTEDEYISAIADAYMRGYLWAMENFPAKGKDAHKAAYDYADKWVSGLPPHTGAQP